MALNCTYIIAGSKGYFGQNFINYLKEVKHVSNSDILEIDIKISPFHDLTKPNFVEYFISILRTQGRENIIKSSQVKIINFAADSFVPDSIINPDKVYLNNINILKTLINFNKRIYNSELIHISTDEVNTTNETPSAYVNSKRMCERMCEQNNIRFIRPVNLIGNYELQEHDCLLKLLNSENKNEVKIHGTGEQKRMFMSVEVACDVLYNFIFNNDFKIMDITQFPQYRTENLRIKDVIALFNIHAESIEDPRGKHQDINYLN